MTEQQAADLLDTSPKHLFRFEEVPDPYNPPNTLTGWLCRQQGPRYGSLILTHVNTQPLPTPWTVFGTPKLAYPFGRSETSERKYQFPEVLKMLAYPKLDGTNVLAYAYEDAQGSRFITYKTRLTPVLATTPFGDFKGMWDEILHKYPVLRKPMDVWGKHYALSFEMYGKRNAHTIAYDVDIDARLLFGISQGHWAEKAGRVMIPAYFDGLAMTGLVLEHWTGEIGSDLDPQQFYEEHRAAAEEQNAGKKVEDGEAIGGYTIAQGGTEGFVIYCLTAEGDWVMYKAKPDSIEKLHWASDSIPRDVIFATALNALESFAMDGGGAAGDELTVAYVQELLREEFTTAQVEKVTVRTRGVVAQINEQLAFEAKVRGLLMIECAGMAPITSANKGQVMRLLSKHFDRGEMKKVYSTMSKLGFVQN